MSRLYPVEGSSSLAVTSPNECFLSRQDEQQRRWCVALESKKVGHGGNNLVAQITGMDVETIRRGRRELDEELANRPVEGVRQEGGGRLPIEKRPTDPGGVPKVDRRRNGWRSDE